MTSNELTVIGLMLALASLLGSLFSIHLSNWLRELLQLKKKCDLNKRGNTPENDHAMHECQYTRASLVNHVPWLMSGIMTLFLGLIVWRISDSLIKAWCASSEARDLGIVLIAFIVIYIGLNGWLLTRGVILARDTKQAIDSYNNR